jgi:hypothetical protein
MNLSAQSRPAPVVARLAVSLSLGLLVSVAQARSFVAEGSDAGSGLGARYVALGGSSVAFSDDVYATYSNPAGLAEVEGVDLSVSRQLNAELRPINFAGGAARLPLPAEWNYRLTLAGAYYPRIHAHSTGAFSSNEVESIFLRYLLPGMPGDFDGEIDTKTKVYRLALGMAPAHGSRWSLGFNLDRIDCRTHFCGVHATSNGYTVISTGATANSYGLGFRYRPSPELTLAGAVSDLGAELDADVVTSDATGTRRETYQVAFPRKVLLGAAYRPSARLQVSADYEVVQGNYGSQKLDLQSLRMGLEYRHSAALVSRLGVVAPTKIQSSQVQKISLPFPLAPTFGLGWRREPLRADLAVYVHPLMSLHKNRAAPAADLSLSVDF